MKSAFYLTTLFLAAFLRPALADEASDAYAACISNADIPIHVTPRFDAPAYEYHVGIPDIVSMSRDMEHSIHEGLSLGLTRYEPMLAISAPVVGIKKSNGATCAHVERVDVSVGYENVVIYIAREVELNTCGFNEVMAHEQKHINVNMQLLKEYLPRISTELNDYLKTNGVIQDGNVDESMDTVKEKVHEIVKTILSEMTRENEERQKTIDSPAEYKRITASCNGQLRDIANRYMRKTQKP